MSADRALALLALSLLGGGPVWGQPAAGQAPEVCRIGVNVEDLYDFDLARETFGAVLWIWSLCPSATIAPLETITFGTGTPGLQLGPLRSFPAGEDGHYQYRRVQGRHLPARLGHAPTPVRPPPARHPGRRERSRRLRAELSEWTVSDLQLQASVSEPPSTYGLPHAERVGYARLEAIVDLKRTQLLAFLKLTSGVFAGSMFAVLTFFFDPRDRSSFNSGLGLLVGVLFAVLISLRASDAMIGDASRLTS